MKEKKEPTAWDRQAEAKFRECSAWTMHTTLRVLNAEQPFAQPNSSYKKSLSMFAVLGIRCCTFPACGH